MTNRHLSSLSDPILLQLTTYFCNSKFFFFFFSNLSVISSTVAMIPGSCVQQEAGNETAQIANYLGCTLWLVHVTAKAKLLHFVGG